MGRATVLLAVCLGVAGCGYFGGSHPATSAHSLPNAQALQPLDPTAKALAGMVDAVGPSEAEMPVELKFSIRNRPEVGQDDEIDYALVPHGAGIDTLHVAFGAADGLEVKEHGPSLAAIKPADGMPIFGSVTIQPVNTGLFTLTAAVGVHTPNQSVGLLFRIPVIVGEGPTQAAANRP
ncbi:MAG: hypothetical protein ACREV7_07580 [Steroidobacteraceae bacterium]